MILNIMMNKSILEVDDIEVCSAEVLKFCTSLAPKIPSNPWQNIANITGNFLIVVSTSFVVVLLTMYRKRKEFRFEMVNPFLIFSHFDMRLFSEARYYRSVPDLLLARLTTL